MCCRMARTGTKTKKHYSNLTSSNWETVEPNVPYILGLPPAPGGCPGEGPATENSADNLKLSTPPAPRCARDQS